LYAGDSLTRDFAAAVNLETISPHARLLLLRCTRAAPERAVPVRVRSRRSAARHHLQSKTATDFTGNRRVLEGLRLPG
jgi:hypothetical protein